MLRPLPAFDALYLIAGVFFVGACVPQGMYPEPSDVDASVVVSPPSGPRPARGMRRDMGVPLMPVADPPPPQTRGPRPSFAPVRSDVLLLLDRSEVMGESLVCSAPTCPTRWNALVALTDYLAPSAALYRWGLAFYPSQEQPCDVSDCVAVPLNTEDDIEDIGEVLVRMSPGGERPLAAAMRALLDEQDWAPLQGSRTLVVITGGSPTCACEDPLDRECEVEAVEAVFADFVSAMPNTRVHIIGVGVDDPAEVGILDRIAQAGGAESADQVFTMSRLVETVKGAIGQSAPCLYVADESLVGWSLTVQIDDAPVARCDDSTCPHGYVLESDDMLRFGEDVCDRLRDGEGHSVRINPL